MQIVFASFNQGKLDEFKRILSSSGIDIILQKDLNVPEVMETGFTFVENAILKARNACKYSKLSAIGDDSGLEVDVLNGAPGIYTSRYAGEEATQGTNISKLLTDLKEVPFAKRTAKFRCVLVFLRHEKDPSPIISQGCWEGVILNEPIGKEGFGYDPVFFVPEFNCSAAQLSSKRKDQLSHRGKAMRDLLDKLKGDL